MTSKITNFIVILCCLGYLAQAQTIVSTQEENKNVILEEFTGRNCMYCPNGHALAAQLEETYPNDVFVIARHAGGFSPTDYPNLNLPESEEIRAYYDVSSFPSGTINKSLYQGAGPVLGLDKWQGASATVLAQTSYVNIGVEASVNPSNRMLSVHTELYYTSNANTYNEINIVLMQSDIIGFQIGIGPYYQFNHNPIYHFNGAWGEPIQNTSSGSFIDETYTLELPEYFNDIEIDLNDLSIVVYVAEENHEIVSGSGCHVELNADYNNDPALSNIFIPDHYCKPSMNPIVEISNTGNETINSVDFVYSINQGIEQTFTWQGSLEFLEKTSIQLPEIEFNIANNNLLDVSIINDENDLNNQMQKPFNFAFDVEGSFFLEYKTIFESEENHWEIINCDGEIVLSGEDYSNLTTYNIPIELETAGCYDFVFYDSEGNGFSSPSAYLKIWKNEELLFEINNDFGSSISWPFVSDYTLQTNEEKRTTSAIHIYPNPATDLLFIETNSPIHEIKIYNQLGQLVLDKKSESLSKSIQLTDLKRGLYFINIKTKYGQESKKLILH